MKNNTTFIWSFGIIIASVLVGIFVYSQLPEHMASHWNASGSADGFLPKFLGVFLLPSVLLAVLLLLYFLPRIGPLKRNVDKFRDQYNIFIVVLIAFLTYVHGLTLAWNLGYPVNFGKWLLVPVGVFVFYIGRFMKHVEQNWFMGIRTPWTLTSTLSWKKTHEAGSVVFQVFGMALVVSAFIPAFLMWVMGIFFISVVLLVAYSFVVYKRDESQYNQK